MSNCFGCEHSTIRSDHDWCCAKDKEIVWTGDFWLIRDTKKTWVQIEDCKYYESA